MTNLVYGAILAGKIKASDKRIKSVALIINVIESHEIEVGFVILYLGQKERLRFTERLPGSSCELTLRTSIDTMCANFFRGS